jgi:hypothetical protein
MQGRVDCVADGAGLKLNLLSTESQNADSPFHHPWITNGIIPQTFLSPMGRSVNFDNQFCFSTIEVGRVHPERMLTSELNGIVVDFEGLAKAIVRRRWMCRDEIVRILLDPSSDLERL